MLGPREIRIKDLKPSLLPVSQTVLLGLLGTLIRRRFLLVGKEACSMRRVSKIRVYGKAKTIYRFLGASINSLLPFVRCCEDEQRCLTNGDDILSKGR